MDRLDTASGMAAALRIGEASSRELVGRALERLERWQRVTNAFSQVFAEEALAEANEADKAIARGEERPLLGVPVAVKDLFDMAAKETSGCCAAYRGNIARSDAEMVRRLRDAGAVIVGKTNQHELAAGATNAISACGPTANPWDPLRITGGSSGGSGAAVASGVVPIALGSDTGGSIRMPSSMCGCWGLKPTTGRLSTAGMMPMASSLDCPGPMTGNTQDLALAWGVLATGADPAPKEIEPAPLRRAAILRGWFSQAEPETLEALEQTGLALEKRGAEVHEVDVQGMDDILDTWRAIAWAELADVHGGLLEHRELLAPRIVKNLQMGLALTPEERERARSRAGEIAVLLEGYLQDADILLAPTTPFPAPRADADTVDIGGGRSIDVHRGGPAWFTEPVNLAGLPAVAAPAGRSAEGLPLSVQLIGRWNADEALLGLCLPLEGESERFRADIAEPRDVGTSRDRTPFEEGR
ncbi:MAG: amidase [Actinomycetota bacterium]|nr:amidase [Actinomycetota bacterium]